MNESPQSSRTRAAPTPASRGPLELVLNGYPLLFRQMGTGVYVARLIHGLLRCAPEQPFRVLVPEMLREAVTAEFPAGILEFVNGRPLVNRSIFCDIYWSAAIMRHARRRYPGAVFHSPANLWSTFRPRRLVMTHYDCLYRHFPRLQGGSVRRWWWRATERYARKAGLVLAISQFARSELVRHARVSDAKIRVLYPWVDQFGAEGRRAGGRCAEVADRYGLPAEYLLYVGGYNYHKNIERLVTAYGRMLRRAALPPLVLAGAVPPEDPRLAVCDVRGAIAAAELTGDQVRLIGSVAVADLPAVFRGAKFFVSPSLHEGFGYPPAEAMAVGTPVIVSDCTGLVEVVRDPRCRFDPRSVEAIAAKLLEANAAPERFRCPLPAEFTEAAGVAAYRSALDSLPGDRRT